MLLDRRRAPRGGPHADGALPPQADRGRHPGLNRFLGGAPGAVLVRLTFLSALVGAGMAMLGLTPGRLFWRAYESARALAEAGLASAHDLGGWLAAGAAVVVPLWLIGRLLAASR